MLFFCMNSLYLLALDPIIKTMDKRAKKIFLVMGIEVLFIAIVVAAILLLT